MAGGYILHSMQLLDQTARIDSSWNLAPGKFDLIDISLLDKKSEEKSTLDVDDFQGIGEMFNLYFLYP